MTHVKEIIRWAKSPNGTKVWSKSDTDDWYLRIAPSFNPKIKYIVDDKLAEIRKAFLDGIPIQAKILWRDSCPANWDRTWNDYLTDEVSNIIGSHNGTEQIFRIKKDPVVKYQIAYKTKGMGRWQISSRYYKTIEEFNKSYTDNIRLELKSEIVFATAKNFEED